MTEWNVPDDPPVRGHAAVGFVVGQRHMGVKPSKVMIEYVDGGGDTHETPVHRDPGIQQVEFDGSDSVRFVRTDNTVVEVAGITAAKPIIGSMDPGDLEAVEDA